MRQYSGAIENIEEAFEQVKEGINDIKKGLSVLETLDWDEIFEDIDPDDKKNIMMLIEDGIGTIQGGLYIIEED
ncbi:hypothetical protein [Bacillus phage vB_BanS-Thrax1]|nr:hypothetical protein [Bacillus phage vB_BanS-Thrax1]